ncbi:CubicO group peptidase (beta-lactamase class C family) [Promicromonospora sp. AC04]|uniref:serine hydrolase domain-containing protein n=1 Tax=Promicromonospora sp. AC04 TaxID=2135723 RepID=UPI000D340FF0|nr:serine hydrolase domain-containing protein [Promicromonospora sp. AC04]PUB26103.1 CubicO group peptidase (beta-lactamase class C family) [Promicromonospora sp. AC04]
MAPHLSRRAALGLFGTASAAALAPASADAVEQEPQGTRIPRGLRPGGELDQLVADKAAHDEFSGSLLLTHRGRTVLARSHGLADKQRAISNTQDTAFALASVTKLATAVAVAQQAQLGTLSYREPLGTYLDGFPDDIAGATVHHLLTHTSGLGDYHQMPGYQEAAATWTSPEQVMTGITDLIRGSQQAFPAGAGYTYSNSGFHLLGEIVARVSGTSYYDYVRRNVFTAAGMTRADFVTKPQWRADRRIAHPYHRDAQGGWVDALEEFGHIGTPAGDAFATCDDLSRFARYLYQQRFLQPAHTQLVLSGKVPTPRQTPPPGQPLPPQTGTPPQTVYQCYGPTGALVQGQWTFGHGGGNAAGISTVVDFYPDTDWVLVALSNYSNQTVLEISALTRDLVVAA